MKKLPIDGNSLTIPLLFSAAADWLKKGEFFYGVTTGLGEFSNVTIKTEDIERLQENLIISHSAGVGEPLPIEVVRAMIVPIIPSKGSVGSSGDLVPLSHLVLTMMGKGKVLYEDILMDSCLALKKVELEPLRLGAMSSEQ
ncbi:MAG: aromatic amino acid lyase [Bacteroidota bacterium]|nr:aromatic amino acid lyase [Bacteroidota bacterium]